MKYFDVTINSVDDEFPAEGESVSLAVSLALAPLPPWTERTLHRGRYTERHDRRRSSPDRAAQLPALNAQRALPTEREKQQTNKLRKKEKTATDAMKNRRNCNNVPKNSHCRMR